MKEEELLRCGGETAAENAESASAAETARIETPEGKIPKERDFDRESKALAEKFPELLGKALPDEVVAAALRGEDLVDAYMAFVEETRRKEKRQTDAQRQNESAASRAPVLGVTGGAAVRARGEDDFLRGFHADD